MKGAPDGTSGTEEDTIMPAVINIAKSYDCTELRMLVLYTHST